jgi:hypothetical protein
MSNDTGALRILKEKTANHTPPPLTTIDQYATCSFHSDAFVEHMSYDIGTLRILM